MRDSNFENVGLILWIVGGLIFLFAVFVFDASVEVNTYSSGLIELPDRVVNVERVSQQLLLALLGASFFVSGFVIHVLALMLTDQNSISGSHEELPSSASPLDGKLADPDAGSSSNKMVDEYTNEELMEKFNIKVEGDHFVFESYRYEKLADALVYARNHKNEMDR